MSNGFSPPLPPTSPSPRTSSPTSVSHNAYHLGEIVYVARKLRLGPEKGVK